MLKNKYLKLVVLGLFLICGAVFLYYFFSSSKNAQVKLHQSNLSPLEVPELPALEVGDWVVRLGTYDDSRLIQQLSHSEYSHIGMIVQVKPTIKVVHAQSTEDDLPEYNGVLITDLVNFWDAKFVYKGAILRPKFLSKQEKELIAESVLRKLGQPFVLADRQEPHLYCTTLLYDEIFKVHPGFRPTWSNVRVPFTIKGNFLFPQAFIEYPEVEVIYRKRK